MSDGQTIRSILIKALRDYRGDDAERARRAFAGRTPSQMQEKYQGTGLTCQQILDQCEERERQANDALEWVFIHGPGGE